MGMDQYHSIPINHILRGWTSILMWTTEYYRGIRFWPIPISRFGISVGFWPVSVGQRIWYTSDECGEQQRRRYAASKGRRSDRTIARRPDIWDCLKIWIGLIYLPHFHISWPQGISGVSQVRNKLLRWPSLICSPYWLPVEVHLCYLNLPLKKDGGFKDAYPLVI